MIQEIVSEHWLDEDGNPAGGVSSAVGLTISWQNGPLGRGENRRPPNGAFVETVTLATIKRLEFYQASKFACAENAEALVHLNLALHILENRTKNREARQVEGTHAL